MTYWTNPERAGYLPQIFLEDDPRTAQEQANERYAHGGGWMSFKGFELHRDINDTGPLYKLRYPGDPSMRELSRANFHGGLLVLFESSWVAIIDATGEMVDVSRMD